MYPLPLSIAQERLHTAIDGRLCVQAWLGYGEVLFLGLGDEPLPPRGPGDRHPTPPYELQTTFADWWVQEDWRIRGTSDDERAEAEATAALLVGRRALGWEFIGRSRSLRVHFDGGFTLWVVPFSDEEYLDQDAWSLRDPDDLYLEVTCRGELSLIRGDTSHEHLKPWVAHIPLDTDTAPGLFDALQETEFEVSVARDLPSLADGHPDILLLNVRALGEPGDWAARLTEALTDKISWSLAAVPTLIIDPPAEAGWEMPDGLVGYDARLPWPCDPAQLSEVLHRLFNADVAPVADEAGDAVEGPRRPALLLAAFEARMQALRASAEEPGAGTQVDQNDEGSPPPAADPKFSALLDEIEAAGREQDASKASWLADLTQFDDPGPTPRAWLLANAALAALARTPDAALAAGRAIVAALPIDASPIRKENVCLVLEASLSLEAIPLVVAVRQLCDEESRCETAMVLRHLRRGRGYYWSER